jgi:hypothetical protein
MVMAYMKANAEIARRSVGAVRNKLSKEEHEKQVLAKHLKFSIRVSEEAAMQGELHILALRFARLLARLAIKDPEKVPTVLAGLQLIHQTAEAQSRVRQHLTADHSTHVFDNPSLHDFSRDRLAKLPSRTPETVLDHFIIFDNDNISAFTKNLGRLLARNENGISFRKLRGKDATYISENFDMSSMHEYKDAAEKHDPLLWKDLVALKSDLEEEEPGRKCVEGGNPYSLPVGYGNTGTQAGVINGGVHGW